MSWQSKYITTNIFFTLISINHMERKKLSQNEVINIIFIVFLC